jgi:hypothetical protein
MHDGQHCGLSARNQFRGEVTVATLTHNPRVSSFFQTEQPSITIVSGLPRSGTSMMMRMLEAADIEILEDNYRTSDDSNPNGYYEFSLVKKMADGDIEWLEDAAGKAVKVVSVLLQHLPDNYNYKVIFMQRELHEVVTSQRVMLERENKPAKFDDSEMAQVFSDHLEKVQAWLAKKQNMDVIYINYNEVLTSAGENLLHLSPFLGQPLNFERMLATIDPSLYRNRHNSILRADKKVLETLHS